ncbi:MAG: hypothetical protein AAF597_15500 [Bacteroidota bacterium]
MQLTTLLAGTPRLVITFVAIIFSLSIYGQQSSAKSFQLEAQVTYQNYRIFDVLSASTPEGLDIFDGFEASSELGFGAGLRVVNDRNWYTRYGLIGLSRNQSNDLNIRTTMDSIVITSIVGGRRISLFNVHLRYERGKYFNVGKKITCGLGVMVDPVFSRRRTEPYNPLSYPATFSALRLDVGIIPSVAFRLINNLHLTLETPLPILRISYRNNFTDNPIVLESERRKHTVETDLFYRMVQVAVGVRYDL